MEELKGLKELFRPIKITEACINWRFRITRLLINWSNRELRMGRVTGELLRELYEVGAWQDLNNGDLWVRWEQHLDVSKGGFWDLYM